MIIQPIPLPIELLQEKLNELERARDKSELHFFESKIGATTHMEHMENLTPKIETYRFAIRTLNLYM